MIITIISNSIQFPKKKLSKISIDFRKNFDYKKSHENKFSKKFRLRKITRCKNY